MKEIDALLQRHSVRNYTDRKIGPEVLEKLGVMIDDCNRAGDLHLQLLKDAGKTFSRLLNRVMGLGSAPSVIICAGRESDTLEERIGYWGEKVVLRAQELGLNTCWAGTFSAKNAPVKPAEGERAVIAIAVGYGADQGRPHRSKTIEQVTSGRADRPAWFTRGAELALLAPTAINQQKFELRLNDDDTVTAVDKGGPFSRVDLGIVKYHFDLAREEAGLPRFWDGMK